MLSDGNQGGITESGTLADVYGLQRTARFHQRRNTLVSGPHASSEIDILQIETEG